MLETGQLVAVGTGSPTIGLYRFSVDAFRVVDIYFLVVAKAFLVVYSVEVLFEVVLMGLGYPTTLPLRGRCHRTWWAAGGPCLDSCSPGLLGGESSSWLIARACRWLSELLVVGDGSVCGVGAESHPKRARHGLCLAILPACPC
jgi:hypothetical protein